MADDQHTRFINDIIEIKTTTAALADLVSRLDDSTSKLTDLSSDIGRLLAVQESRLQAAEKAIEKLTTVLDERRDMQDARDKILYKELEKVEKSIEDRVKELIEANAAVASLKIKQLSEDMSAQHHELNQKIRVFERVMWGAGAIGSVIIFAISQYKSLRAMLGFE